MRRDDIKVVILNRCIERVIESIVRYRLNSEWGFSNSISDLRKWLRSEKLKLNSVFSTLEPLSVEYEDLLLNPKNALARIGDYIGNRSFADNFDEVSNSGTNKAYGIYKRPKDRAKQSLGKHLNETAWVNLGGSLVQAAPVSVSSFKGFLKEIDHEESDDWPILMNLNHPNSRIQFRLPENLASKTPITNVTLKGARSYARWSRMELFDNQSWIDLALSEAKIRQPYCEQNEEHSDVYRVSTLGNESCASFFSGLSIWGENFGLNESLGPVFGVSWNERQSEIFYPYQRRRLACLSSPSIGIRCIRTSHAF